MIQSGYKMLILLLCIIIYLAMFVIAIYKLEDDKNYNIERSKIKQLLYLLFCPVWFLIMACRHIIFK